MKLVIGVTALAGCATLMVAGCGTTHVTPGSAGASPASSSPPASTAATAATPLERAKANATAILASFASPSRATRLSGAPDLAGDALRAPVFLPASSDVVDHVSWWRVPGQPQAVLAWEKTHLPRDFTASGTTRAGSSAPVYADEFALPPVTGVLSSRVLDVAAVSAGNGQTDLRVDAVVQWQPAKPASERVPSTAKAVTITAVSGPPTDTLVPAPVTITAAATVRRLATLVDGLGTFPSGRFACPIDTGRSLRLTFTAEPGGPALAVVTASLGGCGAVGMEIGGKQQPTLVGGTMLAQSAQSAAGLHWSGYEGGGGTIQPGGPERPVGPVRTVDPIRAVGPELPGRSAARS